MVGGGSQARPGEISLAHLGVLFLDELPEFGRAVLESLRQPLEAGRITVARAQAHVTYPARFQLVAAMNPCRCGHLDDAALACPRAPRCGADYQARISGPLLDRIDLHVEVPAAQRRRHGAAGSARRLGRGRGPGRGRAAAAGRPLRRARAARAAHQQRGRRRAARSRRLLRRAGAARLLRRAAQQLHLTARGYHRVLRVARSIADLDGSETIRKPHIAEAIAFRRIARARIVTQAQVLDDGARTCAWQLRLFQPVHGTR